MFEVFKLQFPSCNSKASFVWRTVVSCSSFLVKHFCLNGGFPFYHNICIWMMKEVRDRSFSFNVIRNPALRSAVWKTKSRDLLQTCLHLTEIHQDYRTVFRFGCFLFLHFCCTFFCMKFADGGWGQNHTWSYRFNAPLWPEWVELLAKNS